VFSVKIYTGQRPAEIKRKLIILKQESSFVALYLIYTQTQTHIQSSNNITFQQPKRQLSGKVNNKNMKKARDEKRTKLYVQDQDKKALRHRYTQKNFANTRMYLQ
jgi:hypothetical protein